MVAENLSPRNDRPGTHCNETTLVSLLDETLSTDQQSIAEAHLSSCTSCQRRMEMLVGDARLWTETRSIYADTIELDPEIDSDITDVDRSDCIGLEPTIAWLRSISESPRTEHPNSIGRIDRYDIETVIGAGGMGVVVAAYDATLGRQVALKFLAPHLAGVAPARRRFAREARAAAAIVHPAIMPIYGVNEKSHPPYLVMPLVGSEQSGRSLQDLLDAHGALSLEASLGIAAQIAEGLAAAHDRGVVHRDIKPGNILTEENSPRVLISDFGLARAIDDATVTVSGMVAGTPQYMSPEQASGDDAGTQSDVFSLGSVLYSMLTGRPPFVAESPIAVLRKVIDTPAKAPSQRDETLPPWVNRLLDQFHAKDPDQRIESAQSAAELLRGAEAHVRNPSTNALPTTLRLKRNHYPYRLLATLATFLVVAAGALTYLPTLTGSRTTTNSAGTDDANPSESLSDQAVPSSDLHADSKLATQTMDLSWEWSEFDETLVPMRREIDAMEQSFFPMLP